MIIVGLTGRTGSGKSTVGKYYQTLGAEYIDTDRLSREVTLPGSDCLEELKSCFGDEIINPNGTLNRPRLGEIALVGGKNYNKLNEITHRHILAEVRRRIDAAKDMGREVVIVDAPLLFESGFDRECNYIIGVISDDETSVKRVTARDNIDKNTARKRLEKQKSNDFLKANCHFIIENNSTAEELLRRAREIYDTIGGKG